MHKDKVKRIYYPVIYNIVNSEDSEHVQNTLKEIKSGLSKGEYDELPEIDLIKGEVKTIIPHFSKNQVREGHMRYLGLTESQEAVETEQNNYMQANSMTEAKIAKVYKLNIKSFFIYLVNTKSDNAIVTNEKIELIWGMYDTNKKNQIDLDQMQSILSNFNSSNYLYFEKETLSEIALILFEQLDPYKQGFITKEAFVSHLLQFKDKPVSLNLLEMKKADAVKSEPPSSLEKSKFKLFLRLNFKSVIWLIIYILSNIGFGAWFFYSFYSSNPNLLPVAFAKFFAAIIMWNMALLLLFACENFFTLFSRSFIFTIFPFKDLKSSHKLCGYVFMLASLGHTLAHLFGTYFIFSSTSYQTLNQFLYTKLSADLSYIDCLFGTISGITGLLIIVFLLIIFVTTLRSIVNKNFEIFWYLHKLYYFIFICTFLHGTGKLVGEPKFLKFMILPGIVFIIEIVIDFIRFILFRSKIISIKILESDVVEFITTKPKYFDNQPGQYARINIPEISRLQYHPFTIASAPHHTNLVFYIAPLGNWTKELVKMAKNYNNKSINSALNLNTTNEDLAKSKMKTNLLFYAKSSEVDLLTNTYCYLDGPLGAPCERYGKYKKLIFFAAGIGATPFASILFSLLHDMKENIEIAYEEVHFIWVIRNIQAAYWLIQLIKRILAEDKKKIFKMSLYITSTTQKSDLSSFFLWHGLDLLKEQKPGKASNYCENVFWGRPNFKKIMENKRIQHNIQSGNNKIGVFVCANYPVSRDVLIACRLSSKEGVNFIFHKENF